MNKRTDKGLTHRPPDKDPSHPNQKPEPQQPKTKETKNPTGPAEHQRWGFFALDNRLGGRQVYKWLLAKIRFGSVGVQSTLITGLFSLLVAIGGWWFLRGTPQQSQFQVTSPTQVQRTEADVHQYQHFAPHFQPTVNIEVSETFLTALEPALDERFMVQQQVMRQMSEAIVLEAGLQGDRRRAAIAYNEGLRLSKIREYHEAEHQLHDAIALGDKTWTAPHVELSAVLAELGRLDDAIREARAALAIEPGSDAALQNLCSSLQELNDYEGMLAAADRSLAASPHRFFPYVIRAVAMGSLRRHDEQLREATTAYHLAPTKRWAIRAYASALAANKHLLEAELLLRSDLSVEESAETRANLAVVLYNRGDLSRALEEITKAVELAPDTARPREVQCAMLLLKNRPLDALRECRKAVRLAPRSATGHYNLGRVYKAIDDRNSAVNEFRIAVDLEPHVASFHGSLGAALLDEGRYEEAVAEFRKGITGSVLDLSCAKGLAVALAQTGGLKKIIESTKEALAGAQSSSELHALLGVYYLVAGERDNAIEETRLAVAQRESPTHLNATLGGLLLLDGRTDEAVSVLEHAVEMRPMFADAYLQLARGYAIQGRFNAAATQLNIAIEQDARLRVYADFDPITRLIQLPPASTAPLKIVSGRDDGTIGTLTSNLQRRGDVSAILHKLHSEISRIDSLCVPIQVQEDSRLDVSLVKKSGTLTLARDEPNPRFLVGFDHVEYDGILGKRMWHAFDGRWLSTATERTRQVQERELALEGEKLDLFDQGFLLIPFDLWAKPADLQARFDIEIFSAQSTTRNALLRIVLRPRPEPIETRPLSTLELLYTNNAPFPEHIVVSSPGGTRVTTIQLPQITSEHLNVKLPKNALRLPSECADYVRFTERRLVHAAEPTPDER